VIERVPSAEPLCVLIADDHPLFRDGLRGLLESVGDLEVVAEAATGETAVDAARELHPDVILMDLNMPGLDGIEAPPALFTTARVRTSWWSRCTKTTSRSSRRCALERVAICSRAPARPRRCGRFARWPMARRSSDRAWQRWS
jgi:DNA-binding NarL/FixJ family response regulator